MSYHAHSQEEFDYYKEMIEACHEHALEMNSWAMKFVADLKTKLNKHGRDLSLSEKQAEKLEEIYIQYCSAEPRQKDTVNGFKELENRDKGRRFR